jgi:iron complex transport system substrate-binding protein
VLLLEWTDPPFTAGHWVPDLVVAGGGTPVLADPGRDSRRVDVDAVRATAADVVVVAPCGYHLDAAADLGAVLVERDAVPDGAAVWAVDADSHFVRPGPRVVDGAEIVARILHPDRLGAPDPASARRLR